MQEDKLPLFDAVETVLMCIEVYARMLPRLVFRKEAMRRAAVSGYLNATDLADYLVGKGLPFREAHECVGKAVAFALEEGKELDELELAQLQRFSPLVDAGVFEALSVDSGIARRVSLGGTAPAQVREALESAKTRLAEERRRLAPEGDPSDGA
jgi:argininosuccinate lyase